MTLRNPLAVEPLLRCPRGPLRRRFIPAGHVPIIKPAGSGVSKVLVVRWISLRNIPPFPPAVRPPCAVRATNGEQAADSGALRGLPLPGLVNPNHELASRARSVSVSYPSGKSAPTPTAPAGRLATAAMAAAASTMSVSRLTGQAPSVRAPCSGCEPSR
jgi:hypothetical protein